MNQNYFRTAAAYGLSGASLTNSRPASDWWTGAVALCLLLLNVGVQAQQRPGTSFFREDAAAQTAATGSRLSAALLHSRPLTLDVAALQSALAAAPLESQAGAAALTLALPMPEGGSARFAVVEAPIMEPALAAQFPAIKTYRGVGLDDATATVRLDLTPLGFHAQVLATGENTVYIDPITQGDTQHYLAFYRRDMNRGAVGSRPVCGVVAPALAAVPGARRSGNGGSGPALLTTGSVLRTYRLAVAATGEYTAFFGGTVAAGQAAIVTAMNRVNGVFETELAIRMMLVTNNSSVVYTNAATDPYDNTNPGAMLSQNQANLNTVIGSANYDIGHVFSTGGGGVAALASVCTSSQKAQGVTGVPNPVGNAFYIDFIAHEMGHQFGANHTFNSGNAANCTDAPTTGTRHAATAFEPGSGSTIMAYAGICNPDNIQSNSDAYFHVASYDEIEAFVFMANCGSDIATGNALPVVTLPASGKVLPVSTPFKLTASGTDADGDPLTYCWEEYDLGPAGAPIAPQVNGQTNPLFRSFLPTASPTRYFPRLSDLVNNTSNVGERLPTVNRALKFRVTLRDQHNSGGSVGLVGGINSSPTVNLSATTAAGPFVVTSPNTAVSYTGNTTQTVTWNVAGTDANGVNCATVNILLSTDGGFTYPTTLLAGTLNDGSASVTIPNTPTSTARIQVEAADNYFFDISNANFTITAGAVACNAPTGLTPGSVTTTTAQVSFTPSGSATSYTVTTSPITTTQTVSGSPVSFSGLTPSTNYTVSIVSSCAGGTTSSAATTSFTTAAPPCDAPTGVMVNNVTYSSATVSYTASASATTYTIMTIPTSTTQTVSGTTASLTGLNPSTGYTVYVVSNCAGGATSAAATASFITAAPCNAPTNLTPGSVMATTALVGFTPSSSATSYTVTTSPATTTQTVSSSPVSFSGLTANTTYTVSIVSNCAGGATSSAATTSFTTATTNLTVNSFFYLTAPATYHDVTVTGTGILILGGTLTVTGTLLVQSGGTFKSNCHTVDGPGNFMLAAGGIISICSANGLSLSGTTGDVQVSGTRSFSTDASYSYVGSTSQVTGLGLPATVRNLTDSASTLSLSQPVAVRRVLTLHAGNLLLGSFNLTLLSDASGTAMVVNNGNGRVLNNGSGVAVVQRFISPSTAYTGPGYRHYSSPVANTPVADLAVPGNFTPLVDPAYNALPTPTIPASQFPNVFSYDQSRLTATFPGFDAGWVSPNTTTDPLVVTKGYTVNIAPTATVDLRGLLNNGNLNTDPLGRAPVAEGGWQFLGNPYPAPLDWNRVTSTPGALPTGLANAIYVFEPSSQYGGFYRAFVNNVGTGGFSGILPAMQGFFTRTTQPVPSGFTFRNAFRLTTYANPAFHRSATDSRPTLRLTLAATATPALADETALYLEAGATTTGTDTRYDAPKLANPGAPFSLATQMSGPGNEPLAINGLPLVSATGPTTRVPLLVSATAPGTYQLNAASLTGFDATQPVLLLDHLTNATIDLRQQPSYRFTLAQAGPATGRFEVLLGRPGSALATTTASATDFSVWPNPASSRTALHIELTAPASAATATLHDVLDRVVATHTFSGRKADVPIADLTTGTYLLTVRVNGQVPATHRVVIE